jgi:hypothetical protein
MIKGIYENFTAIITLNNGRHKIFPLISGTRQQCLLLPLLFETVFKEINKGIGIEEIKLPLFANGMTL